MPTPIGARPVGVPPTANLGNKGYTPFSSKLTGTLNDIERMVQENAATMDSIQEVGIEMTRTIGALAATISKYATTIDAVLDMVFPLIINLPILDEKTKKTLTDMKALADKILPQAGNAAKIATDVEQGLVNADVNKLKVHATSLKDLTKNIGALLPDAKK
jgi:hypothetical protein